MPSSPRRARGRSRPIETPSARPAPGVPAVDPGRTRRGSVRAHGMTREHAKRRAPGDPGSRTLAIGGGMLLLAAVGWLLLAAEARDGDARPIVGTLGLAALVFVLSRWATTRLAWIAPLLLVAGAVVLAAARSDVLFDRMYESPLGYSNATASFYLLAAAGALLVFARARHVAVRALAVLLFMGCAAVPWLNGCDTAALLVGLLPLGLLARRRATVRRAIVGASAVLVLGLLTTVLLGATYRDGARTGLVDRTVDATLSERRVLLWRDALALTLQNPLTGVGPGRFPEESPVARRHRDTQWPHNEFLRFGAEAGLPALLLLVGLTGWCFARLWWGADDAGTAVAALALGALGLHASIDYILHFPAVAVAGAVLLGAGSAQERRARASVRGRQPVGRREPSEMDLDLSFLDRTTSRPATWP
jgi:hypothetical protein